MISLFHRLENRGPVFLFLAAFLLLLPGLNPTFYVDDSPETVTAAALLGIPHPPGYPLYTLLGHIFSWLPVGSIPFRVNLLSTLLASTVCLVLYLLFKRSFQLSMEAAVMFALLWVMGDTTYTGALSAKTGLYHLTALFLAGMVLALRGARWEWAAFLLGLSLANHWMSMVVFAPGLLLWAWDHRPEAGEGFGKRIITSSGFLILGLSLYLFLPLRAIHQPLLNWGNPVSFSSFLFNFTRQEYTGAEGGGSAFQWLFQAWIFLKNAFLEWPGLLILALAGAGWGWRTDKKEVRGLALSWILLWGVVSVYLNLSTDRLYLMGDYGLASQVFILIFSAGAFQMGREKLPPGFLKRWVWLVPFLVLGILIPLRFLTQRQTDYTYGYDFVLNSFQELPRNALYYCKGDSLVFPSWYFQWVEGKRADLAVVGVDGLPLDWIRESLARTHRGMHIPMTRQRVGLESIPTLTRWIIDKNQDRPLYLSYDQPDPQTLLGAQLSPYGLVQQVTFSAQPPSLDEARAFYLWDHMRLRNLKGDGAPIDSRTQSRLVNDYANHRDSLGLYYENAGDDLTAQSKTKRRAEYLLEAQDAYAKSYDQYFWAFDWCPTEPEYAYNVGNALVHMGRVREAVKYYDQALKINPRYTDAYFNESVADFQLSQFQKAGDCLKEVLELNPDYPRAQANLDYLIKNGWYHS